MLPARRVRLVVVLFIAILCAACTKQNPNVCCTDAADCAAQGLPQVTPCHDGLLCRGNLCIAESCAMRSVIALVDRAAHSDTPVLLIGESGTGKELLARALHAKSPRARGPFVAVNCSAIPEALLENELFGHRQGAFTDAQKDQRGLFQTAEHGTIFLDEIGDLAPALQGKLLRVLQEKEVHPLGASTPVPIDVRVVTATHRNLDARVIAAQFRQDLLQTLANLPEIGR